MCETVGMTLENALWWKCAKLRSANDIAILATSLKLQNDTCYKNARLSYAIAEYCRIIMLNFNY